MPRRCTSQQCVVRTGEGSEDLLVRCMCLSTNQLFMTRLQAARLPMFWRVVKDSACALGGTGISLQASDARVTGLEMIPTQPFQWDSRTQPPDVPKYMRYIESNVMGCFDEEKYLLCSLKQDPSFLSVPGAAACLPVTIVLNLGLIDVFIRFPICLTLRTA